ncbi:MAG TPA: NUDIX hydrolase [Ilumatobacter sp.]|jgi:8-oxo-dGDP phosphatase|nr:NUDIX hydrolase [Ilumatobacter sp.]
MTSFRHLGDEPIHQGYIWDVVVADFESPDGRRFRRDIVRSPGSVGVVPLVFDAEGVPSVVLVSQYRPALGRDLIEVPAGMRDVPGEDPAETGRRELIEEAGLAAGEIGHLVDMLPSPGMTDSVCSIYLATGCVPVEHDRHGPEEDHMEVLHVPLEAALEMIDRGEITDAKTVCGLLAADRRIRREQG